MNNTAQRLHTIREQFARLEGAERTAAELGRAEWPSDVTSNPGELAHAYDIGRELAELESAATPVYHVTVGNIGEVYVGDSAAQARTTFNTYKAQSLANEGRAGAEPVTLWENDEPAEDFAPVVYDLELTDTYAGEVYYSWMERATLIYATEPSDRRLILDAKHALGLTGIKCTREDWPDTGATIQLDPRGLCQRAFITRRDV